MWSDHNHVLMRAQEEWYEMLNIWILEHGYSRKITYDNTYPFIFTCEMTSYLKVLAKQCPNVWE